MKLTVYLSLSSFPGGPGACVVQEIEETAANLSDDEFYERWVAPVAAAALNRVRQSLTKKDPRA